MREDDEVDQEHAAPEATVVASDEVVAPAVMERQDVASPQQMDEAVESLRELVVFLIENLVEEPEQAKVVAEQRGSLVQIQVRLPASELGKVIGRGGRIAKSIRTALMIAGSRHHLRVSLDIES